MTIVDVIPTEPLSGLAGAFASVEPEKGLVLIVEVSSTKPSEEEDAGMLPPGMRRCFR